MKKLLALILAFSFITPTIALAACSDSASNPNTENSTEIDSGVTDSSESTDVESSLPPPESSESSSEPEATPPTPQPTYAQYIQCSANNVNIRSGAGTSYTVLGSAEKNTRYAVIGKSGNWYKTYYRNQTAYVSASYVSVFTLEKSDDEDVENVIAEGYKLLGTPYVYGAVRVHNGKGKLLAGFTTQKFDCSSLVQYVFYKGANKLLDVTTRTQVKQGKYVAKSDLQRGDCIFFTNEERQYNTGVERVGHVAIYLGNNYILHTASDYARIEKISAQRWSFYIEARRFL